MTKINSNRAKNKMKLYVVIIATVIIMGVFLTSPVITFVTAIQSSNMTTNESEILGERSPRINGSINVFEKTQSSIETDLKTSFIQAADIVARQFNNDTILLGGHLGVDQGYLVYKFFAITPVNHTGYKTIVDALRNAAVLSKVYKCVVNVFDPYNNFIKSFDGR